MVHDVLAVLLEALGNHAVDLFLAELFPLLVGLHIDGQDELEYFEVVGDGVCFLLNLQVHDPLDLLQLQSLPEHAAKLLLLREQPGAPLDPLGKYVPDLGVPGPAEKYDRRVHPALDALLLPIHEFDLPADDDEVQVRALDVVHPLEDVVEQHGPALLHQPLRVLYHDEQRYLLPFNLEVQLCEVEAFLHHAVPLEWPLEDQADLLQQVVDEGSVAVPVSAVQPDYVQLVLLVAGQPVHPCRFAAVPRTHQDEAFALQRLLHHFQLVVRGYQDLAVHVVLAHLLHHCLHQLAGDAAAFVMFDPLPVFELVVVRSSRCRHNIIIAPTSRSK